MNIEALATRVYREGFKPEDFHGAGLTRPGIVFVEPIRPPAMLSGLDVSAVAANVPGTAALFFRVLAAGELVDGDNLSVLPGDVVIVRQAHLDPIQPDQNILSIEEKHILRIIALAEVGEAADAVTIPLSGAANDDIELSPTPTGPTIQLVA